MILGQLDVYGQTAYLEFTQRRGRFGKLKDDLKPEDYWALINLVHPELAKLGMSFTHVPASSAALERLFSQWGYVHDRIRNRLTLQKSEKLAYIYHSHQSVDL